MLGREPGVPLMTSRHAGILPSHAPRKAGASHPEPIPIESMTIPDAIRAADWARGESGKCHREGRAAVAQLVERTLAKVAVESSQLFCAPDSFARESAGRFPFFRFCRPELSASGPGGGIGRHKRLKISRPLAVRVRFPSRAPRNPCQAFFVTLPPSSRSCACAAASRAIGTRGPEQET